jgi:solute carrier family 35 protein F5
MQCFLLWFVAQVLFNQSLKLTSVTSNTILSSTSSLFTFALSMIFLREPYSVAKLLSIAACIGGEAVWQCVQQRAWLCGAATVKRNGLTEQQLLCDHHSRLDLDT